jgi:GrpB-like predicted nucleotidyltransferase (UPF0157 family)
VIEIVPHNNSWPAKFAAERSVLEATLAPWLAGPIEHIGSTAVPGLAAKPVIDIMAAVHSLEASRPAIAAVAQSDYVYFPYKADEMHWFCKPSPSLRTHHLHLVPIASPLWARRLRFRDALCNNAALAAQYADLKLQLANQFPMDREAYTDGKTAFVQCVLSQV